MPLEQLTLVLALFVCSACLISSIALVLGKPLDAVSKQVGCDLYTRYVHKNTGGRGLGPAELQHEKEHASAHGLTSHVSVCTF